MGGEATMNEATVTSKGQITIPKDIREHLGLHTGSAVVFVEQDRRVIMQPKIRDPWQAWKNWRNELKAEGKLITEKRFKEMIKESKQEWSKIA